MSTAILGFTGTRKGLSTAQRDALRLLLATEGPREFHHGACRGADEEAVELADDALGDAVVIVAHPQSFWPRLVSKIALNLSVSHRLRLPPRERNARIVAAVGKLVACPWAPEDADWKSGTWATVRIARRAGVPVVVVNRDGSLTEENTCASTSEPSPATAATTAPAPPTPR
jgi:hypothetical protein